MDAGRFDAVARSLFARPTRRRALAAGGAAALALLVGEDPIAGKSAKRRKKKCKPKCNACSKCKNGKCKSTCGAGSTCLVNGGCAVNCTIDGACPPPLNSCSCRDTADGGKHCRAPISDCTALKTCQTTADCTAGQICQVCPGDAPGVFRCATICQS